MARGDWWTNSELLALCLRLRFLLAPFLKMAVERACCTKCRMKSGATEHGRNVSGDDGSQWHHWMRIGFGCMRERFQGGKGFFTGKLKDTTVCHKHLEIEGGNLIEQGLRRCKIGAMCALIAKLLLDGFGCLCHEMTCCLSCFFTVPILCVAWKCGDARLLVKARTQARDASPRIAIPWLVAGQNHFLVSCFTGVGSNPQKIKILRYDKFFGCFLFSSHTSDNLSLSLS